MNWSDDMLMAYVDGELDADTARRLDELLPQRPDLQARVIRHRTLRAAVQKHFDDVLDEPVPQHLSRLLAPPPVSDAVISLDAVRAVRRWPGAIAVQAMALAASLLVGIVVGRNLFTADPAWIGMRSGAPVAQGVLAAALDSQPAGQDAAQPVRIGISFRNRDGGYCRTFSAANGVHGLACRSEGAWRMTLVESGTGGAATEYRTVSSALSPAVLVAVEQRISGTALSKEEEAAALRGQWHR